LMWEISYKHCLGGGSLLTVLKCKILGLMAAAKVFQVNHIDKHTEQKDVIFFQSCNTQMSCNSKVIKSRKASIS
jgi:hypothetical protein